MPTHYPSFGEAAGAAMAHNANMAARHAAARAEEPQHLAPIPDGHALMLHRGHRADCPAPECTTDAPVVGEQPNA